MNSTSPETHHKVRRGLMRVFAWFALLSAGLLVLITLAYLEENWRGARAWATHRRECEAKGEKLTIAALIPAQIPDDKNFALTPWLKPSIN